VSGYRIEPAANHRLDEIYDYTADTWGEAQAEAYVGGLFTRFEAIAARRIPWRRIPAEFDVNGYFCRYERHFIYWKQFNDGGVGIVAILHERMHHIERLRQDWISEE
jgi:toxin ParE1/3/4